MIVLDASAAIEWLIKSPAGTKVDRRLFVFPPTCSSPRTNPVSVPHPSSATEHFMPMVAATIPDASWGQSIHPARRIAALGASTPVTAIGPRKLAMPSPFSTMPAFSAFPGTRISSATSPSTARRSRKTSYYVHLRIPKAHGPARSWPSLPCNPQVATSTTRMRAPNTTQTTDRRSM